VAFLRIFFGFFWRFLPLFVVSSALATQVARGWRRMIGARGSAMKRQRQRKCLGCGAWFRADPRNVKHQRYCSAPACRQASKAASQHQWLSQPENQDYFRGAGNVARVQRWRAEHPGYWRRSGAQDASALQDDCRAQLIETQEESAFMVGDALQDVLSAQPAVLIGLIAHLTDSALQEDIARSTRRLLQLGQDILNGRRDHADQAGDLR
jgi:hypothetical protein